MEGSGGIYSLRVLNRRIQRTMDAFPQASRESDWVDKDEDDFGKDDNEKDDNDFDKNYIEKDNDKFDMEMMTMTMATKN